MGQLTLSIGKVCDLGVVKLLYLIYRKKYNDRSIGAFPNNWEKSQHFFYTKKRADKSRKTTGICHFCLFVGKYLKSYSLMLFVSKYLTNNQLLTSNLSGFFPSDSAIYQLLYNIHRIYAAFEEFPSHETTAVFLDISKRHSIKSGMRV